MSLGVEVLYWFCMHGTTGTFVHYWYSMPSKIMQGFCFPSAHPNVAPNDSVESKGRFCLATPESLIFSVCEEMEFLHKIM